MTGIARYVARQLLIGTALVSVVLVFIVWLTQSLRFLQLVMNRGLPLGTWLELTVYMLPGFFILILPIAFFCVVLFVYNKLSMDKELVVVQAAGMSRAALAMPAAMCAGALTLLALIGASWTGPASVRAFKELQWDIQTDVSQVLLREGAFNALGQGLTVYVRERSPQGELLDIMVNDARTPAEPVTLLAARGAVIDDGSGARVQLYNGSRQVRQGPETLSVLYFDTYALDLKQIDRSQGTRAIDNRERGTFELLSLDERDAIAPAMVTRMRAEAHQRLTTPFNALGYALVAVAWLLLGPHERRGQAWRVSGAILSVIALQAAALGAMNAAAKTAAVIPLMYLIAFGPIALCAYILVRPPLRWIGAALATRGS